MVVHNKEIEKCIIVIIFMADFFQHCTIMSDYEWFSDSLKYIGFFLSILYWLVISVHKLELSVLIWQILLAVGILYTSLAIDDFSLLLTYLLIVTIKNLSVREYMELIVRCQVCQIVLTVLIWVFRVMVRLEPVFYNENSRTIGFCFGHPNQMAMKIIWCSTAYLFLADERTKGKRLRRVVFAEIFGFFTTKSSMFPFGGLIVILYLCTDIKWIKETVNRIAKVIFPVLGGFVYLMAYYYDKDEPKVFVSVSKLVNLFSNWRIAMSSLALRYNKATWLGNKVIYLHRWETGFPFGNYTIDVVYTYLLVGIGIVYFLIISYGLYKLALKKNYLVSLSIMLFAISGLAEVVILYITTSYVLMMFKALIFKNDDLADMGKRG